MSNATGPQPPLSQQLSGGVLLGLGALLVLLVLGLVFLAGPDGRTETLSWLSGVAAVLAGGGAFVGVAQNRSLARQIDTTNTTVDKVQQQTNGALDKRIEAAITAALTEAERRRETTA